MPVSLGIGATVGTGMAIYGAVKANQAKKAAAANIRPMYTPDAAEDYRRQLVESQAGQGMSDASNAAYMNNANAGLATTTGAILKGGGDANALGSAYNNYNTGISNMAMYDDERRQKHLDALGDQYDRTSAIADKVYQLNRLQPWKDRAAAINEQLAAARNMTNAGINTATSGFMGLAKGFMANKPGNGSSGLTPGTNNTPESRGGYAAGLPMGVPTVNEYGIPSATQSPAYGVPGFSQGKMPAYGGDIPSVLNSGYNWGANAQETPQTSMPSFNFRQQSSPTFNFPAYYS